MPIERSVAIDEIALRQHGLVTSDQAIDALGRSRKNRWVSEGRLVAIQPRVFRVLGAPETWHQAVHAAALATSGVVSHRSAAELWGLLPPSGHVEVSVTGTTAKSLWPPAIAHRVKDLRPGLAVDRAGVRLTDPVRTIIDLGLVLPKWSVHRAITKGLSTRLFHVSEVASLRQALGRPGRNGTGVVRQILDENVLSLGKEDSELERRFGLLVRRHGLPQPVLQHEVWSGGRFIGKVDAAYPHLKLAIEVDGYEHHSSPEAFQHDRTRQNHLVALGWTVLRFTWDDVVRDPSRVAHLISEALNRLPAA